MKKMRKERNIKWETEGKVNTSWMDRKLSYSLCLSCPRCLPYLHVDFTREGRPRSARRGDEREIFSNTKEDQGWTQIEAENALDLVFLYSMCFHFRSIWNSIDSLNHVFSQSGLFIVSVPLNCCYLVEVNRLNRFISRQCQFESPEHLSGVSPSYQNLAPPRRLCPQKKSCARCSSIPPTHQRSACQFIFFFVVASDTLFIENHVLLYQCQALDKPN